MAFHPNNIFGIPEKIIESILKELPMDHARLRFMENVVLVDVFDSDHSIILIHLPQQGAVELSWDRTSAEYELFYYNDPNFIEKLQSRVMDIYEIHLENALKLKKEHDRILDSCRSTRSRTR